jgi:integrase
VQQKLMRHSNVATTMNIYGNATLKAKQKANSKVVQMVIPQPRPQPEPRAVAV